MISGTAKVSHNAISSQTREPSQPLASTGLADDLSSAVPLESALGLSKLSSRGSKLFTRPDLVRNFEQLSGDGAALYLRTLSSRVVFENNTSGRYAIFSSDAEGTDRRLLIKGDFEALYPDPSPDNQWIVYARAQNIERGSRADIWAMSVDGQEQYLLAENGTFPTFSADGRWVYFERDRKLIVRYSLESGVEEQIFPPVGSPFNRYQVAKPRVSADGERVFFISDRGGRWQVWGAELRTGKAVHVGRGCEPTLSPDGELLLWVTNGWWGGKTSLITRSLATGRTIKFARPSSVGEFEYYPSFVDGGRKILFSSAPKFAHRHRSSPLSFGKPSQGSYGVWLLDLERDVAVRLPLQNTADRSNDIFPINSRWAKFVS